MPFAPLTAPLAGLYGAVVLARRAAYDRGWLPVAAPPVFLVSVGGLEAGGSGKTPVTGLLLSALASAGRKVGLLTRGYGRASRGLVMRALGDRERATPEMIGDEPAMLVASGIDVPVVACAARTSGARALAAAGCDCAVLDDAFSHRAQGRDVDIVVLRGDCPLGNGHLLPWGSLREPVSSLARAKVVWLHWRQTPGADPDGLDRFCPGAVRVVSEALPGPVRDARTGEILELAGRRVLVAAGIARPSDLLHTVRALGGDDAELVSFADHHAYSQEDATRLGRRARAVGAEAVVVTAKDAIKLVRLWRSESPLWIANQRVRICDGSAALAHCLGIKEELLEMTDSGNASFGGNPTQQSGLSPDN